MPEPCRDHVRPVAPTTVGPARPVTTPAASRRHLTLRILLATGLTLLALQPALAGDIRVDGSFISTVPTGVAPLAVASKTRVDGLNADLLDGLDASVFAQTPARVLRVSPSGGHFTSVQAALDSIGDADAANRYLVQVGPGIYTGQLTMKPFVDIAGSGEGVTFLRGFGAATVTGASNAELRDLTVESFTGTFGGGTGIHNAGTATRIRRVTVLVDVTSGTPVGILNDGAPPQPLPLLRQVTVSAKGSQASGIVTNGASVRIEDSEISATGSAARAVMSFDAIVNLTRVRASAFSGGADSNPVEAIWSSESELQMVDVDARSVGGSSSHAIRSMNGTARMHLTRVRASAHTTGGSNAYGLRVLETDADLTDCEISASGATVANWGLHNTRSSLRIYGSRIHVGGTASTIALHNSDAGGGTGPWAVEIHASQLTAQTTIVSNDTGFDTRIGSSSLSGGAISNNGGTLVCAGVYDEAFTFYPDTCL